jgi:hypothetical protein
VSLFVPQLHAGFPRLAIALSQSERALARASNTTLQIAVHQHVFPAGPPENIMAHESCDALCPLVPNQDLPGSVNHADAGLQSIQNRAENFLLKPWIMKSRSTHTYLYRQGSHGLEEPEKGLPSCHWSKRP